MVFGEDILVEQHFLVGAATRERERIDRCGCPFASEAAPAVDLVLPALECAAEVLELAKRHRRACVGLLDPVEDLAVDLFLELIGVLKNRRGVRVLRLEMSAHLGVVALA